MNTSSCHRHKLFLTAVIVLLSQVPDTLGQDKRSPSEQDDVVRVSTELVQTDVMVFDPRGVL